MSKETKPVDIVAEAKKRFERAKEFYATARTLAIADTKFALGDSDNMYQWENEVHNSRKNEKRVCLTVNVVAQHCNQITNEARRNKPSVKVSPVDDNGDKKTAEIFSGLIRNIQAYSAADDAHDVAFEHSVLGGEGYWRIITEFESPDSFNQVIKIKCCPNPNQIYIDVDCKELDKSDAMWGFVFEDITKEQAEREHPEIEPANWIDAADTSEWHNKDTVRRAEYFYCTMVKDAACLLQDGTTVLKSKMPKGSSIVKERPTEVKKWTWCKLVGGHDKPVDETKWLGEYLPIISVVGKEVNVNGKIERKGLVRDLKDQARMINYAFSETVQTLALQNKTPYLASAESLEGHEEKWQSANIENYAYLPFNAYDEQGNALPMPSREQPAVMPQSQVQLLQLATEQMRSASGQHNANMGIKSEAQSGIGIRRLQQQSETSNYHFPDNLSRALRYESKVLVDLIQKYYDTKRVERVLGIDGKEETATLDPNLPIPYHEQNADDGTIQKIFNPQVGRFDVAIDVGASYQTQRQEAFAAMTELVGKDPALMQVAGDIIMRAGDFPMADQLADRLAKTLPPNLQDHKGGPQEQIAQLSQQAQQMHMQMQQMGQQLQEAQGKLQQAESGQAKAQLEMQGKMQLAQIDAQIETQRHEREIEFKKQQAELDAYLEMQKQNGASQAEQQKAVSDAQAKREQATIDAHLKIEQARQDADTRLTIAKLDNETKEEIAELNAYVDLQKVGMQNEALSSDVNKDLNEKEVEQS